MSMVESSAGIALADRLEFAPLFPIGCPFPDGQLQTISAGIPQETLPCRQATILFLQVKVSYKKFCSFA